MEIGLKGMTLEVGGGLMHHFRFHSACKAGYPNKKAALFASMSIHYSRPSAPRWDVVCVSLRRGGKVQGKSIH